MLSPVTWIRLVSALAAIAFVLVTRAIESDPLSRTNIQYFVATALGYGHILGAALAARRQAAAIQRAFVWASVATAFSLYVLLLHQSPLPYLALNLIAVWHIFENDIDLPRVEAAGLASVQVARELPPHVMALATTAVVGALSLGSAELMIYYERTGAHRQDAWVAALVALGFAGGAWLALRGRRGRQRLAGIAIATGALLGPGLRLSLGDLFSLVALHHFLSFLGLTGLRIRRLQREGRGEGARSLARLVVVSHTLPIGACLVLALTTADPRVGIGAFVFSGSTYAFWAVCHVVQTVHRRERRSTRRVVAPTSGVGSVRAGAA